MSTQGKWNNGILTFSDGYESVQPLAPVVFADDFICASAAIPAGGSETAGMPWATKIVGAAPPTVAYGADAGNGTVVCSLTSANQKQDAGLYMGDQRNFVLTQGLIFEARVKVSTLPTLDSEIVWGLSGDWADGPDAITYSVWFTADGSGEVFCESDDNATDNSVTSGVTLTNSDWAVCKIDATNVSDIKFYINGTRVASGTTFAYAATGANATLQPYLGCYKATNAGVGVLTVDYVRIWQKRS